MCEQCLVNPISFGSPLEGYTLMRARRTGNDWAKGEWALIECNDPTFTWWTTPVLGKKPYSKEFDNAFNCDPISGHNLYEACVKAGFEGGWITNWLYQYLAEWIDKAEITEEGDPFPHLEAQNPSDFSIKKQHLY